MKSPVLLLAGGLGTRIKHLLNDVPKPMAPILGRPFLEYQIRYLQSVGFEKFYISVGHLGQVIIDYFKESDFSNNITFIIEKEPLGTGGAIKYAMQYIVESDFYCLNGDTLFLADFVDFNKKIMVQNYSAAVGLKKVEDVSRYGRVEIFNNYIRNFFEKDSNYSSSDLINAGIYYFQKSRLQSLDLPDKCSLEKDIFPILIKNGLGFWITEASFIDIGTPETLALIEEFVITNHLA